MPRLSEHERPGAIGMLKAEVRVYGVTRYYNCHLSAIQHLRDCYQATRTVKGRHRPKNVESSRHIINTQIINPPGPVLVSTHGKAIKSLFCFFH